MITDLLKKFQARSADAERELIAKQAEFESRALAATQLADELASLQRSVDQYADQLAMADSQLAVFQNGVATLRSQLLNVWGKVEYNGLTVIESQAYYRLVAVELAIEDYPRVRKHLVAKLADAESAMAKFAEQHA